ncbi:MULTISPECIES: dihydroorotase [unclassified Breznakia]|uniref:dihydroorotase n=1 Tax=unclassified Breznakia TaxID=2623764 RepID=UPI002474B503|nr:MULTISPECIES: dihydroorotase [unclassified Breznakia]MDH6367232.1 dihydroorotase [Breznakia sp. PH1-1]MDH6404348.1 dihydroorotase [Breznakia sp. PF1-11]MDH6412057.1 dihydroorotase [Breznakia sp. PFB1-11]MDH6414336.1 dihydroorotase [Breznakia sp. PFB1-14]MDH6416734.1 dihydroorotase [Breznakia sp. PFB1-4]
MIIRNARILVKDNETKVQDIRIVDGKIQRIADYIACENEQILDVNEAYVMPGGVDVHVHLREPGFEAKETIATGSLAAAHGGYTSIFAMPNIHPYPDNVEVMKAYQERIKKDTVVHTYPYATITKGEAGNELVDMKGLKQLGIHWFSDDGVGVQSETMMKQAMQQAKANDVMIVAHTEDMSYRPKEGCMHEGKQNKVLGLVGIPSETEYKQIERDLQLAYESGCAYHICHMSCKESVQLLRSYKAKGANVSGEVTTHHLLLSEEDVHNANDKMNPPLRSKEDKQALIDGLLDGTIDFIANDHAPHTEQEKAQNMVQAPFGIVALETSLPLLYTHFVKTGIFTLEQFEQFVSKKAAKRFGLDHTAKIAEGYQADLVVWSETEGVIDKTTFVSKGKNTPFDGYKVAAQIATVLVDGKIVYNSQEDI